jgi:septal ring-binding cell division protein DamX
MSDAQEPPRPDPSRPTCGAPAERGQLVCLECGSRITLAYRKPPSWKVPAAISAVVLLLAAAGAVIAYRAIDEDAEREVAANPAKVDEKRAEEEPAATETTPEDETEAETEAETSPEPKPEPKPEPPAADGLVRDGPLYKWPRSLKGFTVVLLSNEDRPSAATFARSAAQTRKEKIGVIRSNDFVTLPTGFFVVFAGKYDNRAQADRAAALLGRDFPGAFPQAVRR